eukprot:318497-Chlamydomonas_euryale.AAC.1
MPCAPQSRRLRSLWAPASTTRSGGCGPITHPCLGLEARQGERGSRGTGGGGDGGGVRGLLAWFVEVTAAAWSAKANPNCMLDSSAESSAA